MTAEQQRLLTICDELAMLVTLDEELQALATGIANRGRTPDEANDVRRIIILRGKLRDYRKWVASHHPDGRK